MVQWMNTWSLTWNCSKNKPSVHQLFWLVIIYQLSWPAKKKIGCISSQQKAKKKSGSVIFPTTLRELSGLSLHPDVYNFLYVLSHQLPSFCLMNFQSVRPSISTLFFLPRSCSFFIIYGLSLCYIHRLWLRVGWSAVGGMGGGWFARFQANWNIHVCLHVSLCESGFTCTPPWSFSTFLFMSVVWSAQLLV